MHKLIIVMLLMLAAGSGSAETLSPAKETSLVKHLIDGKPTVIVFTRPASRLEREFLAQVKEGAENRVGLVLVPLKSGAEPLAKQYGIEETPTALVYDRRGKLVVRSSDADEIRRAVGKAAELRRIDWVTEGDPRWEPMLRMFRGRPAPDIIRTMSFRPDYMRLWMEISQVGHFSDGFIPRRTKEMIATYVSALNKCRY
jgi:hypothetical protein